MPLTSTVIGVPTGPLSGDSRTAHVDVEPGLDKQAVRALQHDVVLEAEVLRDGEIRGKLPGRVSPDRGDFVGDRPVIPAVIGRAGHLPAALDGAPDQLKVGIGREPFGGHAHRGADRAMLGADRHMADKAPRRGERHLAAELRAGGGRQEQRKSQHAAARGGAQPPVINGLFRGRFKRAGDNRQQ